jgi:hypothetical protein
MSQGLARKNKRDIRDSGLFQEALGPEVAPKPLTREIARSIKIARLITTTIIESPGRQVFSVSAETIV